MYVIFLVKLEASHIFSHHLTRCVGTMSCLSPYVYCALLCVSGGQLTREDSNGSISQELSGTGDTPDGTSRVPKIKVGAGNTVLAEMKARQDKRTSSPQQVSICEISGCHSIAEEDSNLLGCYSLTGEWLPAFRSMVPSSSRSRRPVRSRILL